MGSDFGKCQSLGKEGGCGVNSRLLFGVVLLLLGGYLLIFNPGANLDSGELIALFWPSIFVIPLGLFFHWLYFIMLERRGVGLLVPGGILLTVGITCQIGMLFNNWDVIWPGFILSVAVGLFELYWFGGKNRWLLIPINMFAVLSLIFFTLFTIGSMFNQTIFGKPVIAVVLILLGLLILFGRSGKRDQV